MSSDKSKIKVIFDKYSKTLTELIKNVSEDVKSEDEKTHLDHIKRLMRLCPQEERLIKTKDTIWDLKNYILTRDHVGLKNLDAAPYMNKDNTDEEKQFILSIIDIIKSRYDDLEENKKNNYWTLLTLLLQYVIEYRQLVKDFQ
jgi:hypothetical protein